MFFFFFLPSWLLRFKKKKKEKRSIFTYAIIEWHVIFTPLQRWHSNYLGLWYQKIVILNVHTVENFLVFANRVMSLTIPLYSHCKIKSLFPKFVSFKSVKEIIQIYVAGQFIQFTLQFSNINILMKRLCALECTTKKSKL